MILQEFDYCRPGTLDEASQLLKDHNNSMILAGGTDLLVKMRGAVHRRQHHMDKAETE